jgi:hypothetical protein
MSVIIWLMLVVGLALSSSGCKEASSSKAREKNDVLRLRAITVSGIAENMRQYGLFQQVKPGMHKQDVEMLLGSPLYVQASGANLLDTNGLNYEEERPVFFYLRSQLGGEPQSDVYSIKIIYTNESVALKQWAGSKAGPLVWDAAIQTLKNNSVVLLD